MSEKLPPLPDLGPEWTAHWANRVHGQMQAYALAAIEAHEARKDLIRFCPECGHLGEVSVGARDCCPDGSHAAYMPRKTADRCAHLFRDLLASAHPAPAQQPLSEEQEREAFEAFITRPPFERRTHRLGGFSSWAGHYVEYMVQLAWEAWKARAHGIGGEK
jgi:hypothetical protein